MKTRIAGILTIAILATGCAGTIQTASVSEAYKKYDRGAYAATLEHILLAENAAELRPEQAAAIAFLKAQALDGLGRSGLAQALYEYIEEQHPDSQYAYLARRKLEAVR